MLRAHGYVGATAAVLSLLTAAVPSTRLSSPGVDAQATDQPLHVVPLRRDPSVVLALVAQRMRITLRPDIPPPAVMLESTTPLEQFQRAAEAQWGFRPRAFVSVYFPAQNAIYLLDDARVYAHYGGSPDDSLAHELAHFLQAKYLKDDFSTEWSEVEAMTIQRWFRARYMERWHASTLAQFRGGGDRSVHSAPDPQR